MSLMIDVTAGQLPLPDQLAVQNLTSEEIAFLAEELVAYSSTLPHCSTSVSSTSGWRSPCAGC